MGIESVPITLTLHRILYLLRDLYLNMLSLVSFVSSVCNGNLPAFLERSDYFKILPTYQEPMTIQWYE